MGKTSKGENQKGKGEKQKGKCIEFEKSKPEKHRGKGIELNIRCGVDLVSISRIEEALKGEVGERFKTRVFTPSEIEYCEGAISEKTSKTLNTVKRPKYESYAARFAAKEAVAKALGTGFGASAAHLEIEVSKDEAGRPRIELSGKTLELFKSIGCISAEVSLSHEGGYAIAFVVLS